MTAYLAPRPEDVYDAETVAGFRAAGYWRDETLSASVDRLAGQDRCRAHRRIRRADRHRVAGTGVPAGGGAALARRRGGRPGSGPAAELERVRRGLRRAGQDRRGARAHHADLPARRGALRPAALRGEGVRGRGGVPRLRLPGHARRDPRVGARTPARDQRPVRRAARRAPVRGPHRRHRGAGPQPARRAAVGRRAALRHLHLGHRIAAEGLPAHPEHDHLHRARPGRRGDGDGARRRDVHAVARHPRHRPGHGGHRAADPGGGRPPDGRLGRRRGPAADRRAPVHDEHDGDALRPDDPGPAARRSRVGRAAGHDAVLGLRRSAHPGGDAPRLVAAGARLRAAAGLRPVGGPAGDGVHGR